MLLLLGTSQLGVFIPILLCWFYNGKDPFLMLMQWKLSTYKLEVLMVDLSDIKCHFGQFGNVAQ